MRGRRRRVGAQRRPRIPPSIPTAPIAKHRRRDAQFPCDLRQRPTAARQQGYCLPLELIGKLTTSLAHSTPSRSSSELSKGVHQFAGGSLADVLRTADSVEAALRAYVPRRRPRADWVQEQSRAAARGWVLPAAVRNAALRERGDQMFRDRYRPLIPAA